MSGRTGIVIATAIEAASFISSGMFSRIDDNYFPVYRHEDFFLIISGIGKAASASASAYLIARYGMEKMFNLGAAGAVVEGFALSEIYHISRIFESDRPHLAGKRDRFADPDILPGFKTATLSTQDMALVSSAERGSVAHAAALADMEGAAFVQACRIFKVKSYLFKIITDLPGTDTDREIIEKVKLTSHDMFDFFRINFLSGGKNACS